MTDLQNLLARVRAATGPATGPDSRLDGELMCLHHGWRFIRFSDGEDYAPAYRDEEPSPAYKGAGGQVHKGTMIFYNPNPGRGGQHHQMWQSGFTPFTASIDAALTLANRLLPGAYWSIDHTDEGDPDKWYDVEIGQSFAQARTAPLAILAALLTALIANQKGAETK